MLEERNVHRTIATSSSPYEQTIVEFLTNERIRREVKKYTTTTDRNSLLVLRSCTNLDTPFDIERIIAPESSLCALEEWNATFAEGRPHVSVYE